MPAANRRQRGPRQATKERLERWALSYLERYAASAAGVRRVLMRRVERSASAHGTDRSEGAVFVDALVKRFLDSGLIDDRSFAEGRVATLRRRGASSNRIRQTLAAKGVAREVIAATLADAAGDLAAAIQLARRRRLGPYRNDAERQANRARDMAVLARAGFGYDVARKVIEAESTDALAVLLEQEA
ncbi:MAG: RecX family transcriptional regulator [Proteobacteria bacterium]|nr:RecX family transcriptional regulator [Pseudomonadota bacterium]